MAKGRNSILLELNLIRNIICSEIGEHIGLRRCQSDRFQKIEGILFCNLLSSIEGILLFEGLDLTFDHSLNKRNFNLNDLLKFWSLMFNRYSLFKLDRRINPSILFKNLNALLNFIFLLLDKGGLKEILFGKLLRLLLCFNNVDISFRGESFIEVDLLDSLRLRVVPENFLSTSLFNLKFT